MNARNSGPINEIDRYIADSYLNRNKNPLQYWKENKSKYPYLAQFAISFLCCPATSVPCERVFSKQEI